jgi:hypothetical protein
MAAGYRRREPGNSLPRLMSRRNEIGNGISRCTRFNTQPRLTTSEPLESRRASLTGVGRSLTPCLPIAKQSGCSMTFLILDNLKTLGEEPLKELLDAAVGLSEAGTSRVLITTRTDDLHHPSFPTQESNLCRYLLLQGLGGGGRPRLVPGADAPAAGALKCHCRIGMRCEAFSQKSAFTRCRSGCSPAG